ncbi:hypothetical protein BGLA2_700091 [Burkholderia gladioli]|nr:hypothetical protein BGLA2_700091 [Burkholderia gladioli]
MEGLPKGPPVHHSGTTAAPKPAVRALLGRLGRLAERWQCLPRSFLRQTPSALNGKSRHLSNYPKLRGDLHFSVPRTDNMHWLEVLLYEKSV